MERVKRYILTGFVVVVPVILTLYVLIAIFQFADGILGRYLNVFLKEKLGFYIPGLSFAVSVVIVFVVGFFATRFIGKRILLRIEDWFSNLPLVNKIYPALKQIISFIAAQKEFGFKKVVLVEYPSKGIWSIGFLTNEQYSQISKVVNKDMVSVFVPNTPGPLTGYMIFVPKEGIKMLDIPVVDAIKMIISGGVFKPRMKQ